MACRRSRVRVPAAPVFVRRVSANEGCHGVAEAQRRRSRTIRVSAANYALASHQQLTTGIFDRAKQNRMTGKFYYVYMLQSIPNPDRFYVGMTENLEERLKEHNAGAVPHTSKHLPWQVETAVAFRLKVKAIAFEKYLKSHSGRAFAGKHF